MQVLNVTKVKHAIEPELIHAAFSSADADSAEKAQDKNTTDLNKKQSLNRFLEAYCDCV